MITSSRQLKDRIKNLAKKNSADAQILMRNYMTERFLERLSLSEYKNRFILKGGTLVTSLAGLDIRSTMDLDATVKGLSVSRRDMEDIIEAILAVPLEDGVAFTVKSTSEIMTEEDSLCLRVSMESMFDGIRTPFKIDISTGDIITPHEISYDYKLMLEDRTISVMTYNLETLLAEKLEAVIHRGILNTRMRDFYDIHILLGIYKSGLSAADLHDAFTATAKKRKTLEQMRHGAERLKRVEESPEMQNLWKSYQSHYSYASDISWQEAMNSVRTLYGMTGVSCC